MFNTILTEYINFDDCCRDDISFDQIFHAKPYDENRDHHIVICDESLPISKTKFIQDLINKFNITKISKFKEMLCVNADFITSDNQSNNIMIKQFAYKNLHIFVSVKSGYQLRTEILFGIINHNNNEYLILGETGGHPLYSSNYVAYGDSDGSGPNIAEYENYGTAEEILELIHKYYQDFANNEYH